MDPVDGTDSSSQSDFFLSEVHGTRTDPLGVLSRPAARSARFEGAFGTKPVCRWAALNLTVE